ncbi:MAG: beta-1,3-glucanase family protein [Rhizomicrobium sp.]
MTAPPLKIVFQNKSGLPDNKIYTGFVGQSALNATNAATGAPVSISTYGTPSWYTLDTLSKGISATLIGGGRMYFCYNTPWTFQRAGYEPSPVSASDPNYYLRYDKMELTYTGAPADVADTTSIDYFAIPLALNVYSGGTGGTLVGSVAGPSTSNAVIAALGGLTNPANAAVVRAQGTNAFARAIGPGVYPPPPGLPASPYDDFTTYLKYLANTYGPANGGTIATIAGHFSGTPPFATPQTQGQDYTFNATIDAGLNITLKGNGTVVGNHTLLYTKAQLTAPDGIYGANPLFSIDGGKASNPLNDVYGWITGDLLSGLNIGAVGSTVSASGTPVGKMPSSQWYNTKVLSQYFGKLQPANPLNYNRWAGAMAPLSQAYNFAYSDRFAHVTATLNSGAPAHVDTLQIVILPDT